MKKTEILRKNENECWAKSERYENEKQQSRKSSDVESLQR